MSITTLRSPKTIYSESVLSPRELAELGSVALDAAVSNKIYRFSLSLSRNPENYTASLVVCSEASLSNLNFANVFSDLELTQFKGLKFEKRRQEVRLGTYVLKNAIRAAQISNLRDSEISLMKDIFGRPTCDLDSGSAFLSLSHSSSLAVGYAGSVRHPVGVDIEKIEARSAATAFSEMTSHEIQNFGKLNLQPEEWKILNWSIKESYSKAIGVGLTTPFQILEVKEISECGGSYFVSKLRNFGQFYVHSWIKNGYAFSFAVPYKTVILWSTL